MKLRYSIVPGSTNKEGGGSKSCYFIQIHDGILEEKKKGIEYVFVGETFAVMENAHDAIVFCRYLNETFNNAQA